MLVQLFLLFLSSFVIFLEMALLIEFIFFIFRIKNHRMRSLLRLLPIIKLPFDFIFYKFSTFSLFNNFNPFSCGGFIQRYLIQLIPEDLKMEIWGTNYPNFTNFLCLQLSPLFLKIFLISMLLISLVIFGIKIFQFIFFRNFIHSLYASSEPCSRSIENEKLKMSLNKTRATILISSEISVPFCANSFSIFFPKCLMKELSQEEYESVIAHELEHLKWHDSFVKLICNLISSFFWWLPTEWWLKKMESEQEQACDLSVNAYALNHHALAQAVVKVLKQAKSMEQRKMPLCFLADHKKNLFTRLQSILESRCNPSQSRLLLYVAILSALLSFFLMNFWVC